MRIFLTAAGLAIALDQAVKYIVQHTLKFSHSVELIGNNILKFTYVENSGIAFGIFGADDFEPKRWMLLTVIFIAMASIFFYWLISRTGKPLFDVACGLILGGALGNYIDRLWLGRVTDFIEVGYKTYSFPVFNTADSAVSIGVALFILDMLLTKEDKNASDPS